MPLPVATWIVTKSRMKEAGQGQPARQVVVGGTIQAPKTPVSHDGHDEVVIPADLAPVGPDLFVHA